MTGRVFSFEEEAFDWKVVMAGLVGPFLVVFAALLIVSTTSFASPSLRAGQVIVAVDSNPTP